MRLRPLHTGVRTGNAVLSWIVTVGIALLGVIYLPAVGLLWSVLAAFVVVVALLPAAVHRSPTRMAPWPLLCIIALPLVTRTFGLGMLSTLEPVVKQSGLSAFVGSVTEAVTMTPISVAVDGLTVLLTEFADTAALAALALLVVSELQLFSPLRMTVRFGMFFVVVANMGLTGGWAVVRWLADHYFHTGFVATTEALMWEFAVATTAGIVVAILFGPYFCQPRSKRYTARTTSETGGDPV